MGIRDRCSAHSWALNCISASSANPTSAVLSCTLETPVWILLGYGFSTKIEKKNVYANYHRNSHENRPKIEMYNMPKKVSCVYWFTNSRLHTSWFFLQGAVWYLNLSGTETCLVFRPGWYWDLSGTKTCPLLNLSGTEICLVLRPVW